MLLPVTEGQEPATQWREASSKAGEDEETGINRNAKTSVANEDSGKTWEGLKHKAKDSPRTKRQTRK